MVRSSYATERSSTEVAEQRERRRKLQHAQSLVSLDRGDAAAAAADGHHHHHHAMKNNVDAAEATPKKVASTRRWRLVSSADGVRTFVEELRGAAAGGPTSQGVFVSLAVAVAAVLCALASARVAVAAVVFHLLWAVLRRLCEVRTGSSTLVPNETWTRTGRVRADVHVPGVRSEHVFALVCGTGPIRREWDEWYEESVFTALDGHTCLVEQTEVATTPAWAAFVAPKARVSRVSRFWVRDGEDTYTIIACGDDHGDGRGAAAIESKNSSTRTTQQEKKKTPTSDGLFLSSSAVANKAGRSAVVVAQRVTEDLTTIRRGFGGVVVTRVTQVDSGLLGGLASPRSALSVAWHAARLRTALRGLERAARHLIDDTDASHSDAFRTHFNYGVNELARSLKLRADRASLPTTAALTRDGDAEARAQLPRDASSAFSVHQQQKAARALEAYAPVFGDDWRATRDRKVGTYDEVRASTFRVRGPTYLKDRKKFPSTDQLAHLAGCDWLRDPAGAPITHLARRPRGIVSKLLRPADHTVFVINFILPVERQTVSLGIYYLIPLRFDDPLKAALRRRFDDDFANATDADRNDRFKIVPFLNEGPWVAKHALGQKPALLGHGIKVNYDVGEGYVEVDVDIASSSVATGILGILKGAARNIVIDLAFLLEAQKPEDLPEKIIGTLRISNFDLTCTSPILKVATEDN